MAQIIDQSVTGAAVVTPSDTDNIEMPSGINRTKGIYVGVTGDVTALLPDGNEVLFKDLAAGIIHFISVKRINDTGTDATDILALF